MEEEKQKEIETATKQEGLLMDMPFDDFLRYVQTKTVIEHPQIFVALAGARELVSQQINNYQEHMHQIEDEGNLSLKNENFIKALTTLLSLQSIMTMLELKAMAVKYFDYEKMPECFKNNAN